MSGFSKDFYQAGTGNEFNPSLDRDGTNSNEIEYESLIPQNDSERNYKPSFPNRRRPPMYSGRRHNFPPNIHMNDGCNPRFNRQNITPSGFMGEGHHLNNEMSNTNNFISRRANKRVPFKMICFPLVCYNALLSEEDEIKGMECSNRIVAPDSIIQQLCQYENIVSEHVFQINKSENRVSIGKYYTSANAEQPNAIYVPQYIFEGLGIEWGSQVTLNFINESISKGTFARLQPLTNKITEIDDYQNYMQQHLQSNYTCLIKGQAIKFPCFDSQIIMIIHELQPDNIVSITNTDLAIDFEPSIEQRDIERQKEEELRKEQEKAFLELEQSKKEIKLNDTYRNNNQEFLKSQEPETPSFVSFEGTGYSLSSPNKVVTQSQPVSKPSTGFKLNFMDSFKDKNLEESSTLNDKPKMSDNGHKLGTGNSFSISSKFHKSKMTPKDVRMNRLKFLDNIEKNKQDMTSNISVPTSIEENILNEIDDIDILNTVNSENNLHPKRKLKVKEVKDEKKTKDKNKKFKIVLKRKNNSTGESK
jgi:hypothetical protein